MPFASYAARNADVRAVTCVWDGYNIVRELALSNDAPSVAENVWGLDLDGTVQGAGGVGGLLAVFRGGAAYLPAYDANGNVTEYVAASDGAVPAHYDYSPFGGMVLQTGSLADTFTHRFSTKPWCAVTGLYEYQFRKYSPTIGRWMSRDPIGEAGGNAIYASPSDVNQVDAFGLTSIDISGLLKNSVGGIKKIVGIINKTKVPIMILIAEAGHLASQITGHYTAEVSNVDYDVKCPAGSSSVMLLKYEHIETLPEVVLHE